MKVRGYHMQLKHLKHFKIIVLMNNNTIIIFYKELSMQNHITYRDLSFAIIKCEVHH